MTVYQPIDCGHYDMLEIACMDRYEVRLKLDQETVSGVAERLETRDHQEFLWIRTPAGNDEAIRVDRIRTLTVLSRPARFEFHDFSED